MADWADVCAILAELPGTVQDPPERRLVVRVGGKPVAYPAENARSRPDDDDFVVIRTTFEERAALLQEDPVTFHVTPHYATYPGVIVRLSTVGERRLRELLTDAWRLVAPKRLVRAHDEESPCTPP